MYEPADSLVMCVLLIFTLGNKIICSRSDLSRGRAAGGNVLHFSRVLHLTCLHPIIKFSGLKLNWPYSSTGGREEARGLVELSPVTISRSISVNG